MQVHQPCSEFYNLLGGVMLPLFTRREHFLSPEHRMDSIIYLHFLSTNLFTNILFSFFLPPRVSFSLLIFSIVGGRYGRKRLPKKGLKDKWSRSGLLDRFPGSISLDPFFSLPHLKMI